MGHQLYVVVIAKRLGFRPKERATDKTRLGRVGQNLFIWATIVISSHAAICDTLQDSTESVLTVR